MSLGLPIINKILPYNPNYGLEVEEPWDTLTSQGRGASQTRSFGRLPRVWTLTWTTLTKEERNAILKFYHARNGGYDKFLFLPYMDSSGNFLDDGALSDLIGKTGSASSGTSVYLEKYMPEEDDYFNWWSIEIGTQHFVVTDYDGSNKKLTVSGSFTSPANTTYKLHPLIGYAGVGVTTLNLTRRYSTYSETQNYVYRQGTGANQYEPAIWRITAGYVIDQLPTVNFTNNNTYANGDRQYSLAPLTSLTAERYYTGSWYNLYPVRFHPEDTASNTIFTSNLFSFNTIRLIEVIEPNS